jgi:hypothetical protein
MKKLKKYTSYFNEGLRPSSILFRRGEDNVNAIFEIKKIGRKWIQGIRQDTKYLFKYSILKNEITKDWKIGEVHNINIDSVIKEDKYGSKRFAYPILKNGKSQRGKERAKIADDYLKDLERFVYKNNAWDDFFEETVLYNGAFSDNPEYYIKKVDKLKKDYLKIKGN